MNSPNKNKYSAPYKTWGEAINYTKVDDEGKMWVGNDEYHSQVNFCPMTGAPAPKQMKLIDRIVKRTDGTSKTIKEYTNE